MGVTNIIKIMNEVHPESILMVKIGNFYHEYGRDAYVMSYLFGYQLKSIENNLCTCAFPVSAINKIQKELEDKKISYLMSMGTEIFDTY